MGHPPHLNAQDVLPWELLDALTKALNGEATYLWVPSRESLNRGRRGDYIVALHQQGLSAQEIAERLCLSDRHVRRILAKQKAAGLPSLTGMGQKREEPHE